MQKHTNTLLMNQKGYTLIEVVIALILIGIAVGAVTVNMPAVVGNIEPESVMVEVGEMMMDMRANALRGSASESERTFRIQDALKIPHNGMQITATPTNYGIVNCNSNGCSGQQTICVSGQVICFTPSNNFTFETFSGKLPVARSMFITNKNRQLGIMMSTAGSLTVIELVKDQWHTRTDLQDLVLAKQNIKQQPNK